MAIKQSHVLRFDNGETGVLNVLEDGSWACPICGTPWERFPPYWPNDGELGEKRPASSSNFGQVCPGCEVEYGVEEGCASYAPIGWMARQYMEYRVAWLNRVKWSRDALRQLQENLRISEDEAKRQAAEVHLEPRREVKSD